MKAKVCVIDPEKGLLEDLNHLLSALDYEVLCLDRVIGASNSIREFDPDLLVVEVLMPSISGEKLIEVLRRNLNNLPVLILYSFMEERELARTAKAVQADDFITKNSSHLSIVNRIKVHLTRIGRV